jgi:hypothetical protein
MNNNNNIHTELHFHIAHLYRIICWVIIVVLRRYLKYFKIWHFNLNLFALSIIVK